MNATTVFKKTCDRINREHSKRGTGAHVRLTDLPPALSIPVKSGPRSGTPQRGAQQRSEENDVHFVDDSEVNRVLTFPILIDAIEAAHRRPKIAVHDGYLGDGKGQQLVTRSAVDAGRFMMTKLYTSFPGNLAQGKLPAVQAVCVLFDGVDGRPLAVMDASEITHWKTAADSALGAKQLARPMSKPSSSSAPARWRAGWCAGTARCGRRCAAC